MKFVKADLEVVFLDANDVVATSGGTAIPCNCDYGVPGLIM